MKTYRDPDGVRRVPGRPFAWAGRQYTAAGATEALMESLGFTEEVPFVEPPKPTKFHFYYPGEAEAQAPPLDLLKGQLIADVKQEAGDILRQTDWQVIRGIEEPGKPVGPALKQYRKSVRAAADAQEVAINACSTVEELAALQPVSWPVQ